MAKITKIDVTANKDVRDSGIYCFSKKNSKWNVHFEKLSVVVPKVLTFMESYQFL